MYLEHIYRRHIYTWIYVSSIYVFAYLERAAERRRRCRAPLEHRCHILLPPPHVQLCHVHRHLDHLLKHIHE
jgi:hypothetical protein